MTFSAYMAKLNQMTNEIADVFDRRVFYFVLQRYYHFKTEQTKSKLAPKEEIIRYLIGKGQMAPGRDGKLPDDKPVRDAASRLLEAGYPIIANSKQKGYFIAETAEETRLTYNETGSRIDKLFKKRKGIERVNALLRGEEQLSIKEVM